MLTRLEVQGFKNLLDVRVEFGPFTCIAGANGIGKSNVFDAIEFLSWLASETLWRRPNAFAVPPACAAATPVTSSGTATATTTNGRSGSPPK
ncbi:AAA family ATPase [Goodfellowiella coeruleoviolacea]|uniref:RecF/RecN/SMC N terminal domain-containing protein n=1 Tax=Goodfellowiella coeruleoviolacea TaxID=334858 RepID=A0AAE3GKF7_9PSEU|nr:AAA family ATPase [Goodfellowiella coeruleoviolacea]MCP2169876.1 RecF/RecN/SMC N terminal domain-containing protein [Goodfellowiella coeruleoviolacea]